MKKISRFFHMKISDQVFLARCILVLCIVRFALSIKLVSLVRQNIARIQVAADADQNALKMVAWGISACSKYVPGATCLTQALAGQYLLARLKFKSVVRIGIERESHENVRAHAWLLSGGFVVLGGGASGMRHYATLVDL